MADGVVVADTDLVIDFLRGRTTPIPDWLRTARLRLTSVTAFELRVGTGFVERSPDIARLLAGRTIPLDARAALHAGEVFAELQARGAGIGVKDALQAGICLRFDLPLATRNVRHFERVANLRLEDV